MQLLGVLGDYSSEVWGFTNSKELKYDESERMKEAVKR